MFGQEYFSTFLELNLQECAREAGVDVDIDLLRKTSALHNPAEGTVLFPIPHLYCRFLLQLQFAVFSAIQ